MHVQSRRVGDSFNLRHGDTVVTVHVLRIKGQAVRIGLEAPPEVIIELQDIEREARVTIMPCSTLPLPGEDV